MWYMFTNAHAVELWQEAGRKNVYANICMWTDELVEGIQNQEYYLWM